MTPVERLREMMARAESFRPTMMDEELVILNALPALLACAEALTPMLRGMEEADYYCPDDVAEDHAVLISVSIAELREARAALSALAQAQEKAP